MLLVLIFGAPTMGDDTVGVRQQRLFSRGVCQYDQFEGLRLDQNGRRLAKEALASGVYHGRRLRQLAAAFLLRNTI